MQDSAAEGARIAIDFQATNPKLGKLLSSTFKLGIDEGTRLLRALNNGSRGVPIPTYERPHAEHTHPCFPASLYEVALVRLGRDL